ncbi:hypothetical protein PGB90_008018 [Kerria lacca]
MSIIGTNNQTNKCEHRKWVNGTPIRHVGVCTDVQAAVSECFLHICLWHVSNTSFCIQLVYKGDHIPEDMHDFEPRLNFLANIQIDVLRTKP